MKGSNSLFIIRIIEAVILIKRDGKTLRQAAKIIVAKGMAKDAQTVMAHYTTRKMPPGMQTVGSFTEYAKNGLCLPNFAIRKT